MGRSPVLLSAAYTSSVPIVTLWWAGGRTECNTSKNSAILKYNCPGVRYEMCEWRSKTNQRGTANSDPADVLPASCPRTLKNQSGLLRLKFPLFLSVTPRKHRVLTTVSRYTFRNSSFKDVTRDVRLTQPGGSSQRGKKCFKHMDLAHITGKLNSPTTGIFIWHFSLATAFNNYEYTASMVDEWTWIGNISIMILRGGNRSTWRWTLPSVTFSTINPIQTALKSNQRLRNSYTHMEWQFYSLIHLAISCQVQINKTSPKNCDIYE
jgi:hypothetical protein